MHTMRVVHVYAYTILHIFMCAYYIYLGIKSGYRPSNSEYIIKKKITNLCLFDIERKWHEIFLVLNTINVSFTLSLTVATARQRSSLHLFNSYLQHLLRRLCFYILNMYECTLWYFSVEIKQNTKKRAIVFNVDIWWGYWTLSLEPASRPV